MGTSRALRYLRDYVAIPSVNPMGRDDLPAEICGEERLAVHLCEQLRRLGLDARVIGEGARRSVVAEARAQGPRAGEADTLMVDSHIDTVPVDGMTIDPFDPVVHGARLYRRGTCDTKAGMAALVVALEDVLARGTLRRNVVVVGEADEELGSRGVRDVLEALGTQRPDWVLATEPTGLRIVHAHKGIAHARVVAHGRACHASEPAAGRNAIVALARATLAFEELAARLAADPTEGLGPPSLSIGRIGGGQAPNIVPDEAWLVLDRRLLPGEDADTLRRELEQALVQHGVEDVEVASSRVEKDALGTPPGHPIVQHCRAALRSAGREPRVGSVAFGTDAGVFAGHGIPGVVMGPGSIARAHTAAEYVETDEVETMVEVFRALLETPPGASSVEALAVERVAGADHVG